MNLLEVKAGADLDHEIRFENEDGTAINLTGYLLLTEVIWTSGVIDVAITPVDLVGGRFDISLTEVQTATLQAGRGARIRITYTPPGGKTDWEDVGLLVLA